MKKITMITILVLNFFCFAEDFTYMSYEDATRLLTYYNNPAFPTYDFENIVNFPLQIGLNCQTEPIYHTIENITSKYVHYSLANCNGKNYVSSIKNQGKSGTCSKWAATAATEIIVSTLLDDYIQSNIRRWSPINLSEAWTIVTTENDFANESLLVKMSENGTIHGYYFPFYSKQNNNAQGEPIGWENYWNEIMAYTYHSPECNAATNGTNYTANILTCMFHEAKNQDAIVVYPLGNNNGTENIQRISIKNCVERNHLPIICPLNSPYGGIDDNIQPDYYQMEQSVKNKLKEGLPILLSLKWKVKSQMPTIHTNFGYDFLLTEPLPLSDFEDTDNKIADQRKDVIDSLGKKYNFQIDHAVVIVGYLENRCWDKNENGICDVAVEDTNRDLRCTPRDCDPQEFDYFIIKNSHGNTDALNIIKVPSSFNSVRDTNSTQRLIHSFSMADNSSQYLEEPITSTIFFNEIDFKRIVGFDNNGNVITDDATVYEDGDEDGIPDFIDNCPAHINSAQKDSDNDGIGDNCDNCPSDPNSDQRDSDGDGVGDACDKCGNFPDWQDIDQDGIPDACDNCPNNYNPSQIDSDWDGIADACDNCPNHYNPNQEDDDADGVGNICDNCPDTDDYNPREINNSEIVLAPCESYSQLGLIPVCTDGGARNMLITEKSLYKDEKGNWWWQPDHDLDGIGDVCDNDTIWSDFTEIPTGTSVENGIISQNNNLKVVSWIRNETLSVGINMLKSDLASTGMETATTRYCWVTKEELNSWGEDGYCTTEAGHTYGACETNFGYSHGTDPEPIRLNKEAWKFIKKKGVPEESDEFTEMETCKVSEKTDKSKTIDWNWRYDFKQDRFADVGTSLDTASQCTNFSFGICHDENVPKFYYTMSTGVHSGNKKIDYITNGNEINPAFFKNTKKYTRSSRLTLYPVAITYHTESIPHLAPIKYCIGSCSFLMEDLHDIIIDRLLENRPYANPGMEHYYKNDYGSDLINTGVSFREWNNNALGMPSITEKSRPLFLLTITKNTSGMNTGVAAVLNDSAPRQTPQSSALYTFEITEMDANSNGDWRTKGVIDISETPDFMPASSVYHNGNLYLVNSEGKGGTHIYQIVKTNQTVIPPEGYNFCFVPVPIFIPIQIGTLTNFSKISLHSVGNTLLALGKTTSGMKVYKLSELNGNPYFEDISGANLPLERDVYNVEVKDGVLYLAGGALLNENEVHFREDIWRFTEADGWQLIRNDLNIFPVTLRIDFDGDNIILTDRVIRPNGTTNRAIFPADGTGDIVIETVPVEGANVQGFGDYCLKETGTALQGGIETSGECVPFTHPWYSSFSAGATVYSLDGKGNRLYVGTNNAIKIYDISDPTSPVLVSSFSTSSRVNDIEVYGDALFAATNSGLYKLDASNDTLTQTLFVSAFLNSQYKAEVYNGKLYVGEDNGIKVRDLDNLSVLTSVNNGSVLDFAIENGEIGLYKDALFSPVEIRDADTLTLKANEFFGCFEIEVGSSDGRFYLSCDDETYRFEDDGDGGISFTELSGDIRELQDVYTFDGYTYFYDENTIWISTSNDVPAICGNGVVEGDEVCDGGQINCEELDSNYVSGTATCNATCDGYNTNNCSDDGW